MGSDYAMSPPPAPTYAWIHNDDKAVLYVYDSMSYSDGMWHRQRQVPWTPEVAELMSGGAGHNGYLIYLKDGSDFQFGETEDNETIRELVDHRNDPREPDAGWVINKVNPSSQAVREALGFAVNYGGIDGAHHKDWVLDQMVRLLAGDRYEELIAAACYGEDGPDTYEWNEGIAP